MYSKLRELRKSKKYTTEDMGKKLGISKAFYCQIENNKRRLSYDMAVRISEIFKLKPDTIFYDDAKKIRKGD
ncbi:MAG TPA: helix-turn-helix transcriptional regulator [Tenericutes bacterium]|nr:helix-turn-helix transcriptional regulator [Mycoplasmatota bacterium]